jgi:hypothetical protein
MKGTLFSADFVKDAIGNPKLLEINTDTAFINSALTYIDFTDFFQILENSNITELHVIHKPNYHSNIIAYLKNEVNTSLSFIENFVEYKEEINTLYPISVEDSDSKFVLRLAYDASAIFDETYAKSDINLYKLFDDNNDTESIVEVYYSSSNSYINTIQYSTNSELIPDFVLKPLIPSKNSLNFIKSNNNTSIEELVSNINFETEYILSKYVNSTENYASSIRSFQIIYGADLDICFLGEYQITAILDKPIELELINYENYSFLSKKHYYEFVTNDVFISKGLYDETYILKESGSDAIKNLVEGDLIDSFYIEGYSTNEINTENWQHSGSVLPIGSQNTSSIVYGNYETINGAPVLYEIIVDGDSGFYTSAGTLLLSYKESEDNIKFRACRTLNVNDVCYDKNGNPKEIIEYNVLFLDTNDDINVRTLDVEETDNYIISGSEIVVHNAPCFIAGTKIMMEDGSEKNIEDVVIGDKIISYNFNENINELDIVDDVTSRKVFKTVKYIFDDETELEATLDHPIYVKGKSWSSYDNNLSNQMYDIGGVSKIEIGDYVKTSNDFKKIKSITEIDEWVTVYNLSKIKYNQNFFANNVLVHNRVIVFVSVFTCFTYETPVKMWDGSLKKIGEIVKGDEVLSYRNGEYVKGLVTEHLIHPTNSITQIIKYKNMISDMEHPYYDGNEWKPISEAPGVEVDTQYVDNFYNLEIDGKFLFESDHNFIVEDFIVSGLGDNELLNKTFKRQLIYECL